MGERVVRLTSGLKGYTQRSVVSVPFAVREAGVDGRARAMYLKTNLGKSDNNSQILTTPAWTPPGSRKVGRDFLVTKSESPIPASYRDIS